MTNGCRCSSPPSAPSPPLGADPVYGFVKRVALEIIRRKGDASVLPGLAAMDPAAPLVHALARRGPARAPTLVVAGDVQGAGLFGRLAVAAGALRGVGLFALGLTHPLVKKRLPDTPEKPAAVILPGLPGTSLIQVSSDGKTSRRIWPDAASILQGRFTELAFDPPADRIEAEGPLDAYYGRLARGLSDRFDVHPMGFDWRASIDDTARVVAERIQTAILARNPNRPVHLVGHSMGGVVAMTMLWTCPAVAAALERSGSRPVLLGVPTAGTFEPIDLLLGDKLLLTLLDLLDLPNRREDFLAVLRSFPGLLQLTSDALISSKTQWPAVRDRLALSEFVRDRSAEFWKLRHARIRGDAAPTFALETFYIYGRDQRTIADCQLDVNGKFVVPETRDGDGTVPWTDGLVGNVAKRWWVAATHSRIPALVEPRAVAEILATDDTRRLNDPPPQHKRFYELRGSAADAPIASDRPLRRLPNAEDLLAAAMGDGLSSDDLRDASRAAAARVERHELAVSVVHGSLHTTSNLGRDGSLTPRTLVAHTTRALRAWVLGASQATGPFDPPAISAALVGGDGANPLGPEEIAVALVEAVLRANRALAAEPAARGHVRSLSLFEPYRDIASRAAYALQHCAERTSLEIDPGELSVDEEVRVTEGYFGARPASSGTWDTWSTLTISSTLSVAAPGEPAALRLTVTTGDRAAARFRQRFRLPGALLKRLAGMASARTDDPREASEVCAAGSTRDLRELVRGGSGLLLQLDPRGAAIPWELLLRGTTDDDLEPRDALVRVLQEERQITDLLPATGRTALVVGDPTPGGDAALPGARFEAEGVRARLRAGPGGAWDAEGRDGRTEIHLGGGYWEGAELLDRVPELPQFVFLNTCHAGAVMEYPFR